MNLPKHIVWLTSMMRMSSKELLEERSYVSSCDPTPMNEWKMRYLTYLIEGNRVLPQRYLDNYWSETYEA